MIIWNKDKVNRVSFYNECPIECTTLELTAEDVMDCTPVTIPLASVLCKNILVVTPNLTDIDCKEYKGSIVCDNKQLYSGYIIITCDEC